MHLRALAGIAYERDLSRCLRIVQNTFDRWDSGEIDVWAVNDKIHEFHDEIARELYKAYAMSDDPLMSVAFGIHQGVLALNEVSDECQPILQRILDSFNRGEGNDDA